MSFACSFCFPLASPNAFSSPKGQETCQERNYFRIPLGVKQINVPDFGLLRRQSRRDVDGRLLDNLPCHAGLPGRWEPGLSWKQHGDGLDGKMNGKK
jgi:hypothetical protein